MDLNYDIQTWDMPLKCMAMTKIVQNIVEDARLDPSTTIESRIIESRATERVKKLKLPSSLITQIIIMIRPITEEMLSWYNANGFSICPILTPLGTVDVAKSARSLMKCTDQAGGSPFVQACNFCLEEEIFFYGSRLNAAEIFTYEDSYSETPTIQYFWYEVYKGQFDKKISKNDLSDEQCSEGLKRAIMFKTFHVIKYFLEKLPVDQVRPDNFIYNRYFFIYSQVSVDLCAIFLRLAHDDDSRTLYAVKMIKALLNWPYQHLFLKATEAVLTKISIWDFLQVTTIITEKALQGYQDFDYKGLFFSFWEMDELHKLQLRSEINVRHEVYQLLSNCFLMMDENIVITVFDDLSENTRRQFFRNFQRDCATQIYEKKYEQSTFAMNLCKARYEPYYSSLKNFFEEECTCGIPSLLLAKNRPEFISRKQWNDNFQEFIRLISESETSANP